MRKSRTFSGKGFFSSKNLLTEKQAIAFVVEEAIMVFLIVLQAYKLLGIKVIESQAVFFANPVLSQDILWLFALIIFFIIGYVVITLRDERVWLIHKNFSRIFFGTTKLKIQFATKKKIIFFFSEIVYAVVLAISIFVYLDPDINIVPAPFNYIGFAVLFIIGLVLFSHSKEFRTLVYGPTPMQKRLKLGGHGVKHTTNKKTGSVRVFAKRQHKKY